MTGRDILLYLSLKNNNDWHGVMNDITRRYEINFEEAESDLEDFKVELESQGINYVTMLDDNYPEVLKGHEMPPFVLFSREDIHKNWGLNQINSNTTDSWETLVEPAIDF